MRLHKFILLAVLLFFCRSLFAQINSIDSLKRSIKIKNDTNKVLTYIKIAIASQYEDTKAKREYGNLALNLSSSLGYPFGEARALEVLSMAAEIDKNYVEALEYSYRALDKFESAKKKYETFSILTRIGSVYNYFSDINTATDFALKAKKELYAHPKPELVRHSINNLINLMQRLNMKEEAFEILNKYKYLYETTQKTSEIAPIASYYNHFGNYYSAVRDYEKAIQSSMIAKKYLEQNSYTASSIYCYVMNTLANAYKNWGKGDSAVYYHKKVLEISIANKYIIWEAISNRDLALVYFQLYHNNEKAMFYANLYNTIASTAYYYEDVKRAEMLIADIYIDKKDYFSAYNHILRYVKTSDSLLKIESSYIIKNILYKKGLQDAEEAKIKLISENKKKDDIIKDKQVLQLGLITITLIIFVFSIFVIFLFVQYRMNNNLLKQKTEEILAQNEMLEQQNIQLEILNREKSGIIGIVSHDLKAPLNRIEGLLNVVMTEQNLSEEQKTYLSIASKELIDAKEMIRRILDTELQKQDSEKIKPEKIELSVFLNSLVGNYELTAENKAITIKKLYDQNITIHTDKNYLSRIVDNLVSNAIKFSPKNTSVNIGVKESEKEVVIYIEDEGPGFSDEDKKNMFRKYQKLSAQPTGGENSTGLGLHIVKMLTTDLGGKIELDEKKRNGACFLVTLPKMS